MLRLKDNSVIADGTTRELWFGLGVAERVFSYHGFDCVVTSLEDGTHNTGSLHPKGKAADLRTKHIPDINVVYGIFDELKTALKTYGFDVVWEGGVGATPATTGAHIHIEFDPKVGQSCLTL